MNRVFRVCTGLLVLSAVGITGRLVAAGESSRSNAPSAVDTMRENVEVMRKLLNEGLLEVYGFPAVVPVNRGQGGTAGVQSWNTLLQSHARSDPHELPHPEGVYLKGHGVVYSVTLPFPPGDPRPGAEITAAKPLSAWDRARQELRGIKQEPVPKGHTGRRLSVGEVLVRTLAENGSHFPELQDSEQITVAVTFRGTSSCVACHTIPGGGDNRTSAAAGSWRQAVQGEAAPESAGGGTASSSGAGAGGGAGGDSGAAAEIRRQIALGDLHLRQSRWGDAIRSYGEALQFFEQRRQKAPVQVAQLLAAAEAAGKAAQAMEGHGQEESYRKALNLAADYASEAKRLASGTSVQRTSAATPVPAKLVVSASKKLLEQVASGKMSIDEFRKGATVEFLPAPSTEK